MGMSDWLKIEARYNNEGTMKPSKETPASETHAIAFSVTWNDRESLYTSQVTLLINIP